jgi:hypothetical protein
MERVKLVLKKVRGIFSNCCKYGFYGHTVGVIGIVLQAGRLRV